jgi:hypothetical protein
LSEYLVHAVEDEDSQVLRKLGDEVGQFFQILNMCCFLFSDCKDV